MKINPNKPAGCYLATGPSGVGKTEVAMQLAEILGVPFKRFDMGEYAMENDITKLVGAPPGYKGFEQGGQLTNWAKNNPVSVFVLDEIEKAHEDMDNVLLSLMDKGVVTDGLGNTHVFKNCIIFATTNVGAKIEYRDDLDREEKNELRMEAIKGRFKTEILGRYDSTFNFNPLSPEIYEKVVLKFLGSLNNTFKDAHGGELKQTPELIKFIVEKSYDPAMGGRPARKFIEKVALPGLADYILENDDFAAQVTEHQTITLDLNKDGNICFKGKKGKILGVLKNTAELVENIEDSKISKKNDNPEDEVEPSKAVKEVIKVKKALDIKEEVKKVQKLKPKPKM
jgi:ATP-dependent Clp protease ATP-binding subunit ClpA